MLGSTLAGRKWNSDAVFIETTCKPTTRLTPPAILLCYLIIINPAPVHMYLTQHFYTFSAPSLMLA